MLNTIHRLTDKDMADLIKEDQKPHLILFESRYDANAFKMIDAIQTVMESFPSLSMGAVCMIEEAPRICDRFNILGVPTLAVVINGHVLGESLGLRSQEDVLSQVDEWLAQPYGMKT